MLVSQMASAQVASESTELSEPLLLVYYDDHHAPHVYSPPGTPVITDRRSREAVLLLRRFDGDYAGSFREWKLSSECANLQG